MYEMLEKHVKMMYAGAKRIETADYIIRSVGAIVYITLKSPISAKVVQQNSQKE